MIENSANKANNVYIGIKNVSLKKPLETTINKRVAELAKTGRKFYRLIIEHDGEFITLTWSIIEDKKTLHKILTNIFW
jgi:hypothetical protein